ncbi:MAG: helix-turn-helix transcriptional regulator [Gemmatimonadaceae bacterium]|nr:helix-turn-helix transcriptional regulator [Gemmatimonadaceae bacterium]
MTELFANTRVGVIQLDRRGRIVEANDRARRLLRRHDGLSDQRGMLRAAAPEDDDRLQGLLARALPRSGGQGASGAMLVSRPSLRPRLVLHVKPVAHLGPDCRSRFVAVLVLIVNPLERTRLDPDLVQAVLGLTPAEARIAILLAENRTPRQIAAATGRAYSTVRTHLKHIFAKLGVSRQVEVAQLVLALSSLPGSGDQGPAPPA